MTIASDLVKDKLRPSPARRWLRRLPSGTGRKNAPASQRLVRRTTKRLSARYRRAVADPPEPSSKPQEKATKRRWAPTWTRITPRIGNARKQSRQSGHALMTDVGLRSVASHQRSRGSRRSHDDRFSSITGVSRVSTGAPASARESGGGRSTVRLLSSVNGAARASGPGGGRDAPPRSPVAARAAGPRSHLGFIRAP